MDKQFFSSREIYVRLTSIYRKKIIEYEPYTIMRWCCQVVSEFIKDGSGMVERTVDLGKPINKMLQLPMDIFKLEKVYSTSTGTIVDYSHQGDYLLFSDDLSITDISCYYTAFMIDDDGFPLIKRGYETACEAFCAYNMYKEDFMEGKINGQMWSDIVNTKDWEIEAASRAWDEVNDNFFKKIQSAQVNIAYKKFN